MKPAPVDHGIKFRRVDLAPPRILAAAQEHGAVLLGLFVLHQRRTTAPALDLELFSIRNYAWGNAATVQIERLRFDVGGRIFDSGGSACCRVCWSCIGSRGA